MIEFSALLLLLLPGISGYSLFGDYNSKQVFESNIQTPPSQDELKRQRLEQALKKRDNLDPFEYSRLPPEESILSTGLFHTCAITYRAGVDQDTCGDKACGPVKCWGHDDYGQSSPPPGVMFSQVSAGGFFTCGLRPSGKVACWGLIDHIPQSLEKLPPKSLEKLKDARRMHQMSESYRGVTTQPVVGDGYFVQVSSGNKHACAIKRSSEVECWGRNDYGEGSPPEGKFVQVSHHLCSFFSIPRRQSHTHILEMSKISAGNAFTCGIRPNGKVDCWGKNDFGQSSPPSYPQNAFEQITASTGGDHACGLVRDGDAVRCWGNNGRGQSENQEEGPFLQVTAGTRTTCAVRANNDSDSDEDPKRTTIHCWGSRADALLDHLRADAEVGDDSSDDHANLQMFGLGQDHACATVKKEDSSSSKAKSSVECWWMAGSDFDAHRVPVGWEMVEEL